MSTGTEDLEPETGSQPLSNEKFKLPNRWIPSITVRRYLYGIGLALLPLLVSYGIVEQDMSAVWIAFLGAALGVTGLGVALVNTVEKPEDKAARKKQEAAAKEEHDKTNTVG